MPTPHTLLELRTGQDSEKTAEAAMQLFASIPTLKNNWFNQLLGHDEHLSFEILVENQSIFFTCYVPTRLEEYIKGALSASYPEIKVTVLEKDLVSELLTPHTFSQEQSKFLDVAQIHLRNQVYLPIKSYLDFSDIDPLAPLLSTLSKAQEFDRIVMQFIVELDHGRWKKNAPGAGDQQAHPQQALISKKTSSESVLAGIKIAVASDSLDRNRLLLDSIQAALQTYNQTDGNELIVKKTWAFKKRFLKSMIDRSFRSTRAYPFSIEEMATLYHLPNHKLSGIPNIAWGKRLLGEPPEELPIITKDLPDEIKQNINPYARTTYKNQETVYGIQRQDRRRHMYVIGKTGTGKSTLLANMAINDLKNDEGMCVIDPHGDLVETLLDYIPSRRINDVIYFDPADPDRTVQLNLFEDESVVHRELIASGIVSVFKKLYQYSWGPRLEYILRNSLLTLLKSPNARLSDIIDMLTDKAFRDKLVSEIDDPILVNFWEHEFNQMQDRQRTEAIAPILNKVGQFVSSPLVRNVVNSRKSSFSIEEAMSEGKVVLVNLSQGKLGEDNATLLGAMLITKIQLAAMARVHIAEEDRKDFFLYVDEFQNFATDSFSKILSEARKYRLNLTLANQYIAQIPEDVQKAIFGNCGSMISFVMGADDANVFSKEFGDKYSDEDLVSLGRYQIINRLTINNITSKAFPAETLGLASSNNQNRDKVLRVSRERYAKKKDS
ncbi:MAG: type IV secretion system DNA-binding domain-containing protein [Microgenomates group bacterium]